MPSKQRKWLGMSCYRCQRRESFASEWDVHVSFDLGQILCPQCYLLVASWQVAEFTGWEAERLREGIALSAS